MGGQLILRGTRGPRTSCPGGTHGPRTGCPGGQLVLGTRVRWDNLRGGHPILGQRSESFSAYMYNDVDTRYGGSYTSDILCCAPKWPLVKIM